MKPHMGDAHHPHITSLLLACRRSPAAKDIAKDIIAHGVELAEDMQKTSSLMESPAAEDIAKDIVVHGVEVAKDTAKDIVVHVVAVVNDKAQGCAKNRHSAVIEVAKGHRR